MKVDIRDLYLATKGIVIITAFILIFADWILQADVPFLPGFKYKYLFAALLLVTGVLIHKKYIVGSREYYGGRR